jgi:hypothetical protein
MPTILRIALVGAAVVIVGFLLFKSINVTPPGPTPSPDSGTQPNIPITGPTPAFPPDLLPRTAEAPPDADWTPVFTAAGSDNQRTAPFRLSGNAVRVRFNLQLVEGNAAGIFAAYVMSENQAAGQAGFPDIFVGVPSEGEQILNKPAGSYVLNVQAFGCTWTIDVEEAS